MVEPDALVAKFGEQYASVEHQNTTAQIGMWLFLASEVLFFGSLIFLYLVYRHLHTVGFAEAVRHTELAIGTANAVVLVTSSFLFALGTELLKTGNTRGMRLSCIGAALLGIGFLALKAIEYTKDFNEHLFPGIQFAITGPDEDGARLFFAFYFGATAIHILHLVIGIGLVFWMLFKTPKRDEAGPNEILRVEIVGLYWSFVDIIWITLYPLIYLVGRV